MFDFSSGKWTFFKAHTEKKEKWGWGGGGWYEGKKAERDEV